MSNFITKVIKNTVALVFVIVFIALLKVFFGGDPSLITISTVITTLLIVVPLSIVTSIGIVLYERKNSKGEVDK
jgi:membrane protein YdbS with pleckstrin-like domain